MKERDSSAYNPLVSGFLSFMAGSVLLGITSYINGSYGLTDSMIPVLLSFLVTFIWPINVHAYWEAYRIDVRRVHIDHKLRAGLRILLFSLYAVFVHWMGERVITIETLYRVAASVLLMCSWFWLLFDYMLNYHRDLSFDYIGKSAVIDKIFYKAGWLVMLLCKILLFVISVYIYIRLI